MVILCQEVSHSKQEWRKQSIMKEKWVKAIYIDKNKEVVDFGMWYEVSDQGRIRSYREHGGGIKADIRAIQPRLLKPTKCKKTGYYRVSLRLDGRAKTYLLHRIILSSFTSIPVKLINEQIIDVNHMDENKENNCLSNLEWCTRKHNNSYGTRLARSISKGNQTRDNVEWRRKNCGGAIHNSRPVVGVHTKTGDVIHFESMSKVVECLGIPYADRSVSATIRGKQKTAYGYKWFYEEEHMV